MTNYEREAVIVIPDDECPFCGPDMMQGGSYYVPGEPTEYYYRCSCGAGDDERAYPDGFDEDDDGTQLTQWVIAESQIEGLLPTWREAALESLAEQGAGE